MKKTIKTKMVKDLTELMPESPTKSLQKSRDLILNQLILLRPQEPFKKADGIALAKQLKIPNTPDKK